MDEDKVIRPMDFVRLTNIDELNVIKDTKNHIGLVKEVSRDGEMSIIWIGETYSKLAWFKSSELEVVDNLVSILTCGLANFRGGGFGETEAESRAMLLLDLLEKKILTPDGLNLKEVDRRKEYENEFE